MHAGHRIPLPLVGPQWFAARQITAVFGAPMPRHVEELLRHGAQLGHAPAAGEALACDLHHDAEEVVADVYAWEVVRRSVPSARPTELAGAAGPARSAA